MIAGNDSLKVREVMKKYFTGPGGELVEVVPPDWSSDLTPFRSLVNKGQYRNFAMHLNNLWKKLCRQQVSNLNFNRTSILPMKYLNIVPGGRFREPYYWDSYWTAKGALLCGLTFTVKLMILNMVESIRQYGFVPNGGRIYYTTRSQPPVLTLMVDDYYGYTGNLGFVKEIIGDLENEYDFWLKNRQVKIEGHPSESILFQYRTNITEERPESFIEDNLTAKEAKLHMNRTKEQVFIDITSATESGWDFSSTTCWYFKILFGSINCLDG
ncbi:hypothetical protein ACOME3_006005 [Neoechinorhynchus agilis]